MDRQTDSNQPVATLRDGRLKATISENQSDNGPYYTITLAKVYEDKDGNLRETNSFSQGEVLRVTELGREAHGVVRDLVRERAKERSTQRQATRHEEPRREGRGGRAADRAFGAMMAPGLTAKPTWLAAAFELYALPQ